MQPRNGVGIDFRTLSLNEVRVEEAAVFDIGVHGRYFRA